MKLLFDQNISFRLINKIKDIFPQSAQVRELGLENLTDIQIWEYAKANEYTIVTFDADFYNYSIIKGHPPKIIWLRTGNKTTRSLEKILRQNKKIIVEFIKSEKFIDFGCLELYG